MIQYGPGAVSTRQLSRTTNRGKWCQVFEVPQARARLLSASPPVVGPINCSPEQFPAAEMTSSSPSGFYTLVINDCRGTTGGGSCQLLLKAALSFPAPPYALAEKHKPLTDSWFPKDLSCTEGRLELRLLEFIAEGRISTVYSASVVSATHEGVDITNTMPEKLCIKFAKKHSCRSLARDAWFYEQLRDWQGIITARSYGFFTSTAGEQPDSPQTFVDDFTPWQNHVVRVQYDPNVASWGLSMDWLPDDQPGAELDYTDAASLKASSPWNLWSENKVDPGIAVHVMELLGDPCANSWKKHEVRPDWQYVMNLLVVFANDPDRTLLLLLGKKFLKSSMT